MIKALVIQLFFCVVIVPAARGSFLILRFLLDFDPALHSFFVSFAVGASALTAVLGPILFPFDASLDDTQITKPGGQKC